MKRSCRMSGALLPLLLALPAAGQQVWYLGQPGRQLTDAVPTTLQGATVRLGISAPLTWASPAPVGAQTFEAGAYTFLAFTEGTAGVTVSVDLTFGYSASPECTGMIALASWSAVLATLEYAEPHLSPALPPAALPGGSYVCWRIAATGGSGDIDLRYGATLEPSHVVVPTPTVVDGGMSDAGPPDAGDLDAGATDAGAIDGGAPDAGEPAKPVAQGVVDPKAALLSVGCGCAATHPPGLVCLAAVILGWRRGRRARPGV